MTIFNNLIDNNYVIYGLISCSVCLISGFLIKSYFYSTIIETPNSPQTFNLNLDQLQEVQVLLENKGELENPNLPLKITPEQNKEVQDLLDNEGELDDYLKQIFTKEQYDQYQAELLDPDNDFSQNLQDIFDNFDIF
ncbi:MAG: hypothetical protein E6L00_04755 [Thaumarchaeota archaeon]|jgi:hypothetical protein|nr:MAG: hypothetical protein E6L00_04755 [Nitrososphaerota archaeon]TLY73562.1 MAG: hypothetical protein E6K49_14350 [Gammaproteobacteria bacterium]